MALQHRCGIVATSQWSNTLKPLNPLMVQCLTSSASVPDLRPRDFHYTTIGQQPVSPMSRSNIIFRYNTFPTWFVLYTQLVHDLRNR